MGGRRAGLATVGAEDDVRVEDTDQPSKSPSREAAKKASTTSRWRSRSTSGAVVSPSTRFRARLAAFLAARGCG